MKKESIIKRYESRKRNLLIAQFNLENDERKREKLMERIGSYGWDYK